MRDIHIIKNRLATIEDIYTTLQKNGFFKETETFNYYEILQYLYFMNKLFYDTYLIFKNKKSSRDKKINQLYNNCAGKHLGMISSCLVNKYSLEKINLLLCSHSKA